MSLNEVRVRGGEEINCQCLVVGSGVGGSITASYLARKGLDVLIVEEGGFAMPAEENSNVVNYFGSLLRNGGISPTIGNVKFVFAEACTLGGGATVNSALVHEVPPGIVEEWEERFGIEDFGFEELKSRWDDVAVRLSLSHIAEDDSRAERYFREGTEKLGYRGSHVPAAVKLEGGRYVKQTMLRTYLKDAFECGARAILNARVLGLVMSNGRARKAIVSVRDERGRKVEVRVKFDRVFLCAGATQTPLILLRSGIRENVGKGLQFHPTLRVVARFDEELDAYRYMMPSYQVKEFSPEISMGASVNMPAYILSGLSYSGKVGDGDVRRMAMYYVMIKPESSARIARLPMPGGGTLIRFSMSKRDAERIAFGFRELVKILFAGGAVEIYPSLRGVRPLKSEDDLAMYRERGIFIEKANYMSIHLFGSLPMGEKKGMCAVDSFGRLHDYSNVFVNDASVLPSAPGVNPQGILMAVVMRNLERQVQP